MGVFENPITTGISDEPAKTFDWFNIYPNPNDGKFTLKISNQYTINRNMNLNIFALLGQTVYSESLEMSNKEFYKRINLSNLSKGLYFIRISDSKNDFTGKIVIQ